MLLDYKAEMLLQDVKADKALKKRKRAIEIIEKEIKIKKERRNVNLLSNLHNNISNTYIALHKEHEAVQALKQAFVICIDNTDLGLTEIHDLLQQMMNLINMLIMGKRINEAENILASYESIVVDKIGVESLDYGIC